MKNIIIVGATSAIAKATARLYAEQGSSFYLIARNLDAIAELAKDLIVRGASAVEFTILDVNNFNEHQRVLDKAFITLKKVDIVLLAHGTLPLQSDCENDASLALKALNTNGLSTISLLLKLASKLEPQKEGAIAVITSVAGDRGRPSNYVYGAAKGMVSIFLQGLRARLFKFGVSVTDIKPGFVDTPMTTEFNKGLLWSKPELIARDIVKAVEKCENIIYSPSYWRFIMLVIRAIPEFVFKRLNL